jgi:DNA-binding PadR family transcriptional regulator
MGHRRPSDGRDDAPGHDRLTADRHGHRHHHPRGRGRGRFDEATRGPGGAWTPSPGAVYPTINQLEDEGLVTVTADAGRRLVTLTDTGRSQLAENREAWGDPFSGYDAAAPGTDWRPLIRDLIEATRQVGRAGSDAQRTAAAKVLTDARRAMYLLLANGDEETDTE